MKKPFVLISVLVLASSLFAGAAFSEHTPSRASQLRELVDAYDLQRDVLALAGTGECVEPDPTACLHTSCRLLGPFACDSREETLEVVRACRGNYGDGCVATVCGKVGPFGCDQPAEVLEVARACHGNWGGDCVIQVCAQLGPFGCDTPVEVLEVARTCGGSQ